MVPDRGFRGRRRHGRACGRRSSERDGGALVARELDSLRGLSDEQVAERMRTRFARPMGRFSSARSPSTTSAGWALPSPP